VYNKDLKILKICIMKTKEKNAQVENLLIMVQRLTEENEKYRRDIENLTKSIEKINTKVEKKHTPIYLEKDILNTAQKTIIDSLLKVMTDYGSPLRKLTEEVVQENKDYLKEIISDSFNTILKTDEFKNSIIESFSHKLGRSLIQMNDSIFEKTINELKQDRIFKSKLTVAISSIIEEYLKERNNSDKSIEV